jgi:membrane protease YdiL (CAAX protease family)
MDEMVESPTEDVTAPPVPTKTPRDWFVSITCLLVGAAIVAFLTRFNHHSFMGEEYLVVNVTWLLFVPFLLIFFLFREPAERFGFRLPENGAGRIALVFFLLMVPFLIGASRFQNFQNYYPLYYRAAYDWNALFYWELVYGFYMFCWEFFYRGFLTFGLSRAFGVTVAIGLQTIAFGLMHYGKPTPEFIGSFIAGIALGWLAVRGKSFLPCFVLHWVISVSFDLLAIHTKAHGLF